MIRVGFTRGKIAQLSQSEGLLTELLHALDKAGEIESFMPLPLPATLKDFLESPLGISIMAQLKAAGTYILIVESEPVMSQSVSVSLDGDGFAVSVQVVGMAAAYTKKKPTIRHITPEKAIENIRGCGEYNVSEADIVARIANGARAMGNLVPVAT